MPEDAVVLLGAAAVTAAAFFVQRLTGFGSAILSMPFLALFWRPHDAVNLILIYQTLFAVLLIRRTWRSLLEPRLRWFLLTFVPVLVAGAYLLPALPEEAVRTSIAVVVLIVLAQWLFVPNWTAPGHWAVATAAPFGLLSGIVQGMFGSGGPFFLAWYGSVEKQPGRIRDASIAVFFLANILRLPVAASTAQLTAPVLWAALFTAPLFAAAMFFGGRIAGHIDSRLFRYAMIAILAVAAVSLLFR